MKLNPDCIRDILLTIEELITETNQFVVFSSENAQTGRLAAYQHNEIAYHLRQCDMAGYIHGLKYDINGHIKVQDLTPLGHQFLADVRSDTLWNHTKSVAAKVGSFSIDALSKIATGVVTEMIKRQLS